MKFYVNTELFEPSLETLIYIQQQLNNEYITIKKVANNLQGQSVSLNGIYHTLKELNNLISEIDHLAQKLKQIKRTYDDTEIFITNVVHQLSTSQEPEKLTHGKILYCMGLSSSGFEEYYKRYIKFTHTVAGHHYSWYEALYYFLPMNLKEYPKVMNKIFPLFDSQCEEWFREKVLAWMRENIKFNTGYVPYELPTQKIDLSDIF